MKVIPFTKEGFEKLQKTKQELLSQRPHAVSELKRAREMGDLSENGFYKGARSKLSQIDRQLRHIEHLIKSARITQSSNQGVVDIGGFVTISDGKDERTLQIVGSFEANPLENKISHVSPLGKLLLGKKIGEKVQLHAVVYKILTIR